MSSETVKNQRFFFDLIEREREREMSTKQEHKLIYEKGGKKIGEEKFTFDTFVKYIQHFKKKTKKKFEINEDENLNDHVVFELSRTKKTTNDFSGQEHCEGCRHGRGQFNSRNSV